MYIKENTMNNDIVDTGDGFTVKPIDLDSSKSKQELPPLGENETSSDKKSEIKQKTEDS